MKTFKTEMEKQLWGMLYESQRALAIMCLDEANRLRKNKDDWPAGQEWSDMVGSSHMFFYQRARDKAGIDHKTYLTLLKGNEDAAKIAGLIYEQHIK